MLKAELIGNLGNDAEIKEFGGKKYVALSVATTEYAKDDQGNRTDVTTWVSVLWYGDGGGLFAYLKKGGEGLCAWQPSCQEIHRQARGAAGLIQRKRIGGAVVWKQDRSKHTATSASNAIKWQFSATTAHASACATSRR